MISLTHKKRKLTKKREKKKIQKKTMEHDWETKEQEQQRTTAMQNIVKKNLQNFFYKNEAKDNLFCEYLKNYIWIRFSLKKYIIL